MRHGFRSIILLLTVFASGCSGTIAIPMERTVRSVQPDILLVIVDDQGTADFSFLGRAPDVATPNIDRLAARATYFGDAHVTAPICNASRIGLMTGQYQQRTGNYYFNSPGLPPATTPTLAETLKAGGYRTGYIGKYHYGRRDGPGVRDFPLEHGFDYLFGSAGGRKHYLIHNDAAEAAFEQRRQANKEKGPSQSLAMGAFWEQTERRNQDGFTTPLFVEKARAFIAETPNDRPFFLTVSFNAVHNFAHQLPDDARARRPADAVEDWIPERESYRRWYARNRYPINPTGRADYLAQLGALDDAIGELMAIGRVADNAVIVYISDNGGSVPDDADNRPLRGGKYTLFEGGTRVPLMISLPNQRSGGRQRHDLVSALDLYPTLVELAGLQPNSALDGKSLAPVLRGDGDGPLRSRLYWHIGHELAMRDGRWKWHNVLSDRFAANEFMAVPVGEALYDLATDPGEATDLSRREPERLAMMRAAHADWAAAMSPAPPVMLPPLLER